MAGEKPAFRKYLLRNAGQPIEFGYEGKKYRITIEEVLLFPQGFTALMTQPDLLADEPSLLLLDIGGWTVDLMRIDNGRPNIGTCHSLEFGMIRCIDEVRERVRQNTGLSLTDAQIEQVLAGRPCSLEETVRSLIREQGRLYTERPALRGAGGRFRLPRVAGRHDGRRRIGGKPPYPPHRRDLSHRDTAGRPCQRPRDMSALWPRFGAMTAKGEAAAVSSSAPTSATRPSAAPGTCCRASRPGSAVRIWLPASSRPVTRLPHKKSCVPCCGKNSAKSKSQLRLRNRSRRRRCQNQRWTFSLPCRRTRPE